MATMTQPTNPLTAARSEARTDYRKLAEKYPNLNPTEASELAFLASALGRSDEQVAQDADTLRTANQLATEHAKLPEAERLSGEAVQSAKLANERFQASKLAMLAAEREYQAAAGKWLSTSHKVGAAESAGRELRALKMKNTALFA